MDDLSLKSASQSLIHADRNIDEEIGASSAETAIGSGIADFSDGENEIACLPIGALIGFLFHDDLSIQRETLWYFKVVLNSFAVNLLSLTCLARFLYDLPCSATTIAHTLHLLEYSRCEHLFYNLNSASTALVTADHMFWITRACSRAVFANNILLDLDLDITTIIQLTKRYLNDSLHIWPFPNACVLKCTALCFSTEQNKRLPALQRIW